MAARLRPRDRREVGNRWMSSSTSGARHRQGPGHLRRRDRRSPPVRLRGVAEHRLDCGAPQEPRPIALRRCSRTDPGREVSRGCHDGRRSLDSRIPRPPELQEHRMRLCPRGDTVHTHTDQRDSVSQLPGSSRRPKHRPANERLHQTRRGTERVIGGAGQLACLDAPRSTGGDRPRRIAERARRASAGMAGSSWDRSIRVWARPGTRRFRDRLGPSVRSGDRPTDTGRRLFRVPGRRRGPGAARGGVARGRARRATRTDHTPIPTRQRVPPPTSSWAVVPPASCSVPVAVTPRNTPEYARLRQVAETRPRSSEGTRPCRWVGQATLYAIVVAHTAQCRTSATAAFPVRPMPVAETAVRTDDQIITRRPHSAGESLLRVKGRRDADHFRDRDYQ
jgi:hypothetical protein